LNQPEFAPSGTSIGSSVFAGLALVTPAHSELRSYSGNFESKNTAAQLLDQRCIGLSAAIGVQNQNSKSIGANQ